MKAKNLHEITSESAPREWRQIPEINAQYPKHRNVEKSLQKLQGMNICVWMIGYGGVWKPASDFFYVCK